MTRLLLSLIALFPLPLIVLLFAEPPELFEREHILAVHEIGAELAALDIDWHSQFAVSKQIDLTDVLPQTVFGYMKLSVTLESYGIDEPVLIAQTTAQEKLRYHVSHACWLLPADQFTLLKRCHP